MTHDRSEAPSAAPLPPDATVELLTLAKSGDRAALERLVERCTPALNRWAHGRMPPSMRGMLETADLVQDVMIKALRRIDAFESRHQGALQAYLRHAVLNRIRDLARLHSRQPDQIDVPEQLLDSRPSPLDEVIGSENAARYDAALLRLKAADREAIVGRIEMQYDYEELAIVLGKPSASAARMAVRRAMQRLIAEMRLPS